MRILTENLPVCSLPTLILTNHQERHSEVFPARGLHGSQDCPHHCTANAHKCDHDDEPTDADGLGDGNPAAGLHIRTVVREAGLLVVLGLVLQVCGVTTLSAVTAGPENKNHQNTRKLSVLAWTRSDTGYADN